jgi:hypothetical protein
VRDPHQPGQLPLRPLTTGELLDAAVVLLRQQPGRLLFNGAALALIEQTLLYLTRGTNVALLQPWMLALGESGVNRAAAMFTELLCIGLVAALATRLIPRTLLGSDAGPVGFAQRGDLATAGLTAILAAGLTSAAGWAFFSSDTSPHPLTGGGYLLIGGGWLLGYALTGLAVPSVVLDGASPVVALRRSLDLSSSNSLRAACIRLLGYGLWLLVRTGLVVAAATAAYAFGPLDQLGRQLLITGAWFVVDTFAYPMLGCLDAALHLDTRMRAEGLDIALRRDLRASVARWRVPA